ncbi:MAG TPA: ABC transporter ATP-binding protein [Tepidisphaeraceae bacterium]|jgi:ABC-2 type transport system ATP-binding protein
MNSCHSLIGDSGGDAPEVPVIEVRSLTRAFGKAEAVHDLNISVRPGTIYGLFGRNGAGKSTTIKCLLNLLRPNSGQVRLFGLDPARDEVEVKRRLAYVPDSAAFYPWMTVRQALDYFASFREKWNVGVEAELLKRFRLDVNKRASALSKGQTMQLALLVAICPGPELLILDEPTTGLDPVIRREFVETIVGAYQDADPAHRTIFVSTHLITEFEGLVDDFTILENGRTVLTSNADEARRRFSRIRGRFPGLPPKMHVAGLVDYRCRGREVELVVSDEGQSALEQVRSYDPEDVSVESLDLESIFVALLSGRGNDT